jgi:hypothetical protein
MFRELNCQGFDTNASKVAVLVLAVLWILTLYWAKNSWVAWATIALVVALILVRGTLLTTFTPSLIRVLLGADTNRYAGSWRTASHCAFWSFSLGSCPASIRCGISSMQVLPPFDRHRRRRLTVQDTLARKVNTSDASEYATMIGCCSSKFWGESQTPDDCRKNSSFRRVLASPIAVV